MPANSQLLILRILEGIRSECPISQRKLARELGISLGRVNLLVRELAQRGVIRMDLQHPTCRYLLTRRGSAAYSRLDRLVLQRGLQGYTAVRDRVRSRLLQLDRSWADDGAAPAARRVAFYGAGAVAEIGQFCLQGTDLRLVAMIEGVEGDGDGVPSGVPVHAAHRLAGCQVAGIPFERLVVMSFVDRRRYALDLSARSVPKERIVWL